MFRNKLWNTMMIIILISTLLSVVALVTVKVFYADDQDAPASIDDIVKYSVDLEEITTNLQSGGYVRVKFKVQTDSKNARSELEKREFQVKNIVIHEIANKKASDFVSGEGLEKLEKEIEGQINELMQAGSVEKVYTTSFLLQK